MHAFGRQQGRVSVMLVLLIVAIVALCVREGSLLAKPLVQVDIPELDLSASDGEVHERPMTSADLALIAKRIRAPTEMREAPAPAVARQIETKRLGGMKVTGTIVHSEGTSFAIIVHSQGKEELVPEGGMAGQAKLLKVHRGFVEMELGGVLYKVHIDEGKKDDRD